MFLASRLLSAMLSVCVRVGFEVIFVRKNHKSLA